MSRGGASCSARVAVISTIFTDLATTPIDGVSPTRAPFRGRFEPEPPLAIPKQRPAAGFWQLTVADTTPQETGLLRSWSLGPEVASHSPVS